MRWGEQTDEEMMYTALSFLIDDEAAAETTQHDGNYLAVCQARETVENRLRLDAVGNLISITVLTARGRSLFAEPACSGSLAMSD